MEWLVYSFCCALLCALCVVRKGSLSHSTEAVMPAFCFASLTLLLNILTLTPVTGVVLSSGYLLLAWLLISISPWPTWLADRTNQARSGTEV